MRKTLCLIAGTKNEAPALPKFFEHHAWVDEILVMDSFSTDETQGVCAKYGRSYFQSHMSGNANARHTLALETAKSDWVFFIDPDEFISQELKGEILNILEQGTDCEAFENRRVNFFMGKPLRHGGWSTNALKMFRRKNVVFEGDSYHEKPRVNGKVGLLNGEVHHFPYHNIHWMIAKHNYISEFDKNEYFKQFGVMTEKQFKWFLLKRPFKTFLKCYIKKKGYKDGIYGFVFAMITWAQDVLKICKYWETYLEKNPETPDPARIQDPWVAKPF